MKSPVPFVGAFALVAISSAFAAKAIPGVIPGAPPGAEANFERRRAAAAPVCNQDDVLRKLKNPTRSAGASVFCSSYIQPYATTTSFATITEVGTTFSTETTTTTTTAVETLTVSTTTELCPIQTQRSVSCGVHAYGYASYLIRSGSAPNYFDCHRQCLTTPGCQSWQISTRTELCNLFNAVTEGNVFLAPDDEFIFYDRACPDYLPSGCYNAVGKAKRDGPVPDYLATYPPSRITSACSCFITPPSNTITRTVPQTVTESTTTLIVIPTTVTRREQSVTDVTAVVYQTV